MTSQRPDDKDDRKERAYERLAEAAVDQLQESMDVTVDAISDSLDAASEKLKDVGEFTSDQIDIARMSIQLDLMALADDVERSAVFIQNRLNPGRVASGLLSATGAILDSASDVFESWRNAVEEPLKRTTGEVTGPGTLTCVNCDEQIEMENAGRIPPCWKCHETEFRKGY